MSHLGQRLAKLRQALAARQQVTVITFAPMPGVERKSPPAGHQPLPPGFHRLADGEIVGLMGGSPAAREQVLERLQRDAKSRLVEEAPAERGSPATEASAPLEATSAPVATPGEAPSPALPSRWTKCRRCRSAIEVEYHQRARCSCGWAE